MLRIDRGSTLVNRPDITPAQILAVVQSIVAVAVAFGAPITEAQSVALLALAGGLAAILGYSDARIREGRSRIAAAEAVGAQPVAVVDA